MAVLKRTNADEVDYLAETGEWSCLCTQCKTSAGTVHSVLVGKSSREMLFSARHLFNLTSDKSCVICLYWTDLCQYYSVRCKPESNLKHRIPTALCVIAFICRKGLRWLVWLQASEVTAWNYEIHRGRVMKIRHNHACAHTGDRGARKDLWPVTDWI